MYILVTSQNTGLSFVLTNALVGIQTMVLKGSDFWEDRAGPWEPVSTPKLPGPGREKII